MNKYYPLMLDLTEKPCLVVGGGSVAERKVESLVKAKAMVTVISPKATGFIKELNEENALLWEKREYIKGDMKGFFLVVIATDKFELNREINQDVNHATQFVNIVDTPELCTFIVPSVIDRGRLQIAVSTNGASPALAKKIRKDLEARFGEEYIIYTDFLAEMREWVLNQRFDKAHRKQLFEQLLDDSIFERVVNGEIEHVKEEIKTSLR